MTERRTSRRVAYICKVVVDGERESNPRGRTSDISTDGVFIDSIAGFPVGSVLNFKLKLPSMEIQLSGEVRYCMPQVGMGVRLLDLSPDTRQWIERVVQSRTEPS